MKLSKLEDLKYFANSDSGSSSHSACYSYSATDTDDNGPIFEASSSCDDSSDCDHDPTEVVCVKGTRGVWRMTHIFDGKLYLARDYMQGNFIPKNFKLSKPKLAPKPRAKASSKSIFK